jgi:hypothetical protein
MKTVYVKTDKSVLKINLVIIMHCVFYSKAELRFYLNPVTCRYRVIDVECLGHFCL